MGLIEARFQLAWLLSRWQSLALLLVTTPHRSPITMVANKVLSPDHLMHLPDHRYSEDHKERILDFCLGSGKPWALLMPNYVANKQYFTNAVDQHYPDAASKPLYIVPAQKYEYAHPEGTGHTSSPFFSIWFVQLGQNTQGVYKWWTAQAKPQGNPAQGQAGRGSLLGRAAKEAGSKGVDVVRSLDDLKEVGSVLADLPYAWFVFHYL